MFKKVAAFFSGKKPGEIVYATTNTQSPPQPLQAVPAVKDFIFRYPPFPTGIPVIPVEDLIDGNSDLIKTIICSRGLAGGHNAKEVQQMIMGPICHLAKVIHLLPASEKNHYRVPGGLFKFSLESGLHGIRFAERRILTRVTPELRRHNEALWAHAAFLNGLFSESVMVLSRLSIYSEEGGLEWYPTESLFDWAQRNNLKTYQIKWNQRPDKSLLFSLIPPCITKEQTEILRTGESVIHSSLMSALHNQNDFNNPLAKIKEQIRVKLIAIDIAKDSSSYGKPLTGMHLDPWLIDAMRHLLAKKRWIVNQENGRLWHAIDGVYLIWPLAANDMQHQLKEADCPFVPNTTEILAELMLEAGIIESVGHDKKYLFEIGLPQADSFERKIVTAIRLVAHEVLFESIKYGRLDITLELDLGDEGDIHDDEDDYLYANPVRIKQPDDKPFAEITEDIAGYNDVDSQKPKKSKKIAPQTDGGDNLYDEDYQSGYRDEQVSYDSFEENAPTADAMRKWIDADLLGQLTGSSSASKITSAASSAEKSAIPTDKPDVSGLSAKKAPDKKPTRNEVVLRGKLIIERLRKLPVQHLETKPNNITKVFAQGVKNTDLSIKDCLLALKAADLLILINGLETGADDSGSGQSQYFLVKGDLLGGR